jgi:hypothetical protein
MAATVISRVPQRKAANDGYLPKIGGVYFCLERRYSTIMVNTTVVRLNVVYIGTLTPRTDSIVTIFHRWKETKNCLT